MNNLKINHINIKAKSQYCVEKVKHLLFHVNLFYRPKNFVSFIILNHNPLIYSTGFLKGIICVYCMGSYAYNHLNLRPTNYICSYTSTKNIIFSIPDPLCFKYELFNFPPPIPDTYSSCP